MSLIGRPAPAFELFSQDRKKVSLADYAGRKLVVAFYPAAFTGVCTKEMCAFRDSIARFGDLGADVVGISVDAPFANGAFAKENGVTFPLLSDYTRDTTRAFGVAWDNFAGMPGYVAANRAVFVIGADGTVTYEWIAPNPGVEPDYAAVEAALAS